MRRYPAADLTVNVRDLVPSSPRAWPLPPRLEITREGNPRHTSGKGSRRRSSYEHRLDEFQDFLSTCRAGRAEFAPYHKRRVHVWEGLHSPAGDASRAVQIYREQISERLAFLERNAPLNSGLGMRQSPERAKRDPRATRFYLPPSHWKAFHALYRVYLEALELLGVLATWWSALVPTRPALDPVPAAALTAPRPEPMPRLRDAPTRPPAEEERRAPGPAREAVAQSRPRSPEWLGAILRRVLPDGAM